MTLRRIGVLVAMLLLLVAVARPTVGGGEPSVVRIAGEQDPNVFVIVDRSADMAGQLTSVRDDIDTIIDRYPDARFALISFDARPSLDWPLSADTWSLRAQLESAGAYPRGDEVMTNAGAASNVLRYQLIGAAQQYPRADNLVFYFGSGAPDSDVPQRRFQVPDNAVDGGAVFGYGATGAAQLQAVAEQIGVDYQPRAQIGSVDEVIPVAAEVTSAAQNAAPASGFQLYWVLGGISAVLILLELSFALRHLRRTRLDRIAVDR